MVPRNIAQELLTGGDAADVIGLSVEMVRVLHAQGRLLDAALTPRGYRLFRRADVERLAVERKESRP